MELYLHPAGLEPAILCPKSYALSICTAGASENGLADARVNTHLRLECGQTSLGDAPNGRFRVNAETGASDNAVIGSASCARLLRSYNPSD